VVLYKKVAKDSGMTIKEPSVMYTAWSDLSDDKKPRGSLKKSSQKGQLILFFI